MDWKIQNLNEIAQWVDVRFKMAMNEWINGRRSIFYLNAFL